jgi:hypothetical protein
VEEPSRKGQEVEIARIAARLLDEAFRVPGTNFRIGLDALIGLVPGIGDAVGAALSSWIVLLAARAGAPRALLLRMVLNVAADALIGGVPLLGDLFDAGFKANMRNLTLLTEYLEKPGPARARSALFVAAILVGVLLLTTGAVFLAVAAVRGLAGLAAGGG